MAQTKQKENEYRAAIIQHPSFAVTGSVNT